MAGNNRGRNEQHNSFATNPGKSYLTSQRHKCSEFGRGLTPLQRYQERAAYKVANICLRCAIWWYVIALDIWLFCHIGMRKIKSFKANHRMLNRWHKLPTAWQTLGISWVWIKQPMQPVIKLPRFTNQKSYHNWVGLSHLIFEIHGYAVVPIAGHKCNWLVGSHET